MNTNITLKGIPVRVVQDSPDDKECGCGTCVMNAAGGGPGCPSMDDEREALGVDTDCILNQHHYEAA